MQKKYKILQGDVMSTNITDIIEFFEFAEQKFNVTISFHTIYCKGFFYEYNAEIGRFNTHCSRFCSYVKSNYDMNERCQKQQNIVLKKCSSEVFFGMSYCGLEEFIVPIKNGDNVYGFICIGGFCSDYNKSMRRVKKNTFLYNIDSNKMSKFLKKLSKPDLSVREIKCLFKIAADKLAELMSEYDNRNDKGFKKNIYSEIVAYIMLNYSKKITVHDISKHCYCSESYINHIFKKTTNKSISRYINEIRINKAKELLKTTDINICEIAEKVGFSQTNYFSSIFKEYCNISPKAYRQKHRI